MTGPSIGSGSLALSTNAVKLSAGLDGAYAKIQGWKGKVSASFKSLNVGGMLSNFGAPGKVLGAGFAALTGGGKLFSDAVKSIGELSQIGKKADAIGVASDQFMGLSNAAKRAGVDTDQFAKGLIHQSAAISKGSTATADHLAGIGLNIKDLQGISADKQFLKISDALQHVGDRGKAAAIATEMYGKEGWKLVPMLTQGGEKIQSFIDQQKSLGVALSEEDMGIVKSAKAAVPKIEQAFDGLWNRVVVAMAPLVEQVGGGLTRVVVGLAPVLDWIGRAAESFYGVMGPALEAIISGIGEGVRSVGQWARETFGFASEWPSVGEVVNNVLHSIGAMGAVAFDAIKYGIGAAAVGLGYLIEKLLDLRDTFRKAFEDIVPESIRPSFLNDMVKQSDANAAAVRAASKATQEWGERQANAFGQSLAMLDKWWPKFLAVKKKVKDELDLDPAESPLGPGAVAVTKYQANAAIEYGTTADVSARIRFMQEGVNIAKEHLAVSKEHLALAKKSKIDWNKYPMYDRQAGLKPLRE